jgi:hypothetical protein
VADIAAKISRVAQSNALYKLLAKVDPDMGSFDGGCLIFADALLLAAGSGELVRIASNVNAAEHYGARIDGVFYDADGPATSERQWCTRFAEAENLGKRVLSVKHGYTANTETPRNAAVSEKIAALMKKGV